MKILGYDPDSSDSFKTYAKQPGLIYGTNDVLTAGKGTVRGITHDLFGERTWSYQVEPTIYLHVPRDAWTTFTTLLRGMLLPWRWKVAYSVQAKVKLPILVCTSVRDGELPEKLKRILGKSIHIASLIEQSNYAEYYGKEYLRLEDSSNKQCHHRMKEFKHPIGGFVGMTMTSDPSHFCHMYRARSLFSHAMYQLLKRFSSDWKEVSITTTYATEKVLIKTADETIIAQHNLIGS